MQQATQPAIAGMNAPALAPFTFMKTAKTKDFNFNQPHPPDPAVATAILNVPIPSGKRLVIQFVTVDVALQAQIAVLTHLTTNSTAQGSSPVNDHQLLLTPVPLGHGNAQWICSEDVELYADGAEVSFTIGIQAANATELGTVEARVTVSGHLVTP